MDPIRLGTRADVPVLVELWHAMLVECDLVGSGLVPDWCSRLEAAFDADLRTGSGVWFVAQDGDAIAGTCAVFEPRGRSQVHLDRRATLGGMYVRPEFRGAGIGTRLAERAVAWCKTNGFTIIRLHASEGGRPIYKSLGFVTATEMMRLRLG
jgi:GNAT superfamily N-acetyltransferase